MQRTCGSSITASIIVGEQRQKRNVLAGEYTAEELQHLECFTEELRGARRIVGALKTLAMGDTNAVAYGQVSHLSLLIRTGVFSLKDFMSLRMRPSRGRVRAGLMIDDFLVIECRRRDEDGEEVREKVESVRRAYEKYGLPRHAGKAVEGEAEGEFWGAQLDGHLGILRPSLKKLVPLVNVVLRMLELGYTTVGLLELLSGAFVAAFQLRRRLMSALAEIYAAQRSRGRKEIIKMSGELKDELFCIIGLLAVSCIDFRLKPSTKLVASDASSYCEAAVAADVSEGVTKELRRRGLQKGLWNRLLSPEGAYLKEVGQLEPESELPEEHYKMRPLWEEVVTSQNFRTFGKVKQTKGKQHINLKEVRAALAAEAEMGRQQPGRYYVHLQDSQVALACMTKGRSSSWQINRELRKSICQHVGQNTKGSYGYVRSKLNPGDDPTRGAAVRKAIRSPAEWWTAMEKGEFERLDAFLKEWGCHPEQIAELPPEEELFEEFEIDKKSASEVRRSRGRTLRKQRSRGERNELGGALEEEALKSQEAARKKLGSEDAEAEEATEAAEGAEAAESTEAAERTEAVDDTEAVEVREREEFAEAAGIAKETEASGRADCEEEEENKKAVTSEAGGDEESKKDKGERLELLKLFRADQFVYDRSRHGSLEEALQRGAGLLDLYSGRRGFAKAFVKAGCPWALCFDIKHNEDEDLLRTQTQLNLQRHIAAGSFVAMAAGPVCASFSTAITPPWRTKEYPHGRPELGREQKTKLELGHKQLAFTLCARSVWSTPSISGSKILLVRGFGRCQVN